MNPFVSHAILKDLPFELMKDPNREGIEQFVEKKRQRNMLVAMLCVLGGIILLTINIILFEPELGPILNTVNPLFWFVMGVIFFRKAKNTRLSNGELDSLLKKSLTDEEISA